MFSVTRVRVKLEIRELGRDLLGITVFLSAQPSELRAVSQHRSSLAGILATEPRPRAAKSL